MQIVPSKEASEAADALRELLAKRSEAGWSDAFFEADWSSLWKELEDGGWLQSGRTLAEGADLDDALVELAPLAEVWGEFLIPLPFSEALVLGIESDELRPVGVSTGSTLWMSYADRLDPKGSLKVASTVDAYSPSRTLRAYDAKGLDLSAKANDAVAVLWAAEAVGAANVALQRCEAYSQERIAYGQRIVSYQALRHLMADMLVSVELARTGVLWAAQDPDQRWDIVDDVLSRVQVTIQEAIQIHGGIGFTWEVGMQFPLRHTMALQKLVRIRERALATAGN